MGQVYAHNSECRYKITRELPEDCACFSPIMVIDKDDALPLDDEEVTEDADC